MKHRFFALLLTAVMLTGLLPPAWAAEEETAVYLLSGLFQEEPADEEEMSQGTVISEEGASSLFPSLNDPGREGITGVRNVLVAAVRFQDEPEFVDWTPAGYGGRTVGELMKLTFDGTNRSVSDYYSQQSFGQLQIQALFLNDAQSSIQLSKSRSYFEPLSMDNPEGYLRHVRAIRVYEGDQRTDNVVQVPELACCRLDGQVDGHVWLEGGELVGICEHTEARAVRRSDGRLEIHCRLSSVELASHVWTDSTCFYSNDYNTRMNELDHEVYFRLNSLAHEQGMEEIDCVNLWYSGMTGDWSDILWPHQSYYISWGPTFFRSGVQKRYIQQFSSELLLEPVVVTTDGGENILLPELGTVTHELGHMLGFPDYYSYYDLTMGTMGTWTLMCNQSMVPQNIHGWAAYTYGKWLDSGNVREITTEGYYTLTTLSGATREEKERGEAFIYYLENPASDPNYPEQIVLEYRTGRGDFESSEEVQGYRAADGIILYSVDQDAESRLAGNIAATGEGGRFGARMYWAEEAAAEFLPGYGALGQGQQDLYDMIFSVLTDQGYLHLKGTELSFQVGLFRYGSPDPNAAENALVSRRTGENSGIVICSPATEPGNSKMTFWVDLDAPEVTAVRAEGAGKVTVCFDEPVQLGNLSGIRVTSGTVSAAVEGSRLVVALEGAKAGDVLTIPASAVVDQAGRTMEEDLVLTLEDGPVGSGSAPAFSDVPEDHWAAEVIANAAAAGLFQGADGLFQPEGTLTRGMFVTVLGRLAGVTANIGSTGFTDVAEDAWYAPYVAWAVENGIVTGLSDSVFAPEEPITREQMAVTLARFLALEDGVLAQVGGLPFADQDQVSAWAQEAVRTLRTGGLMEGSGGSFLPQGLATRAEAAALVSRCMGLVSGL